MAWNVENDRDFDTENKTDFQKRLAMAFKQKILLNMRKMEADKEKEDQKATARSEKNMSDMKNKL